MTLGHLYTHRTIQFYPPFDILKRKLHTENQKLLLYHPVDIGFEALDLYSHPRHFQEQNLPLLQLLYTAEENIHTSPFFHFVQSRNSQFPHSPVVDYVLPPLHAGSILDRDQFRRASFEISRLL